MYVQVNCDQHVNDSHTCLEEEEVEWIEEK